MGKSEHRELASRMKVLLAHLLKWRYQPARCGTSWQQTIREQRKEIRSVLAKAPSLQVKFEEADWSHSVWKEAIKQTLSETNLEKLMFPQTCPWSIEQILAPEFYPDS